MLLRGFAFLEPAVVGDVDDDLRTRADELPFETRHRVFETDRWDQADFHPVDVNIERIEVLTFAEGAVVGAAGLFLVDFFQERNLIHEGNRLAKDHEVVLSE